MTKNISAYFSVFALQTVCLSDTLQRGTRPVCRLSAAACLTAVRQARLLVHA